MIIVNRTLSLRMLGFTVTLCLLCTAAHASHAGSRRRTKPAPALSTIAGLQSILAAQRGKSDRAVTRVLSQVTLIERLSSAAAGTLAETLPGPRSRSALAALADSAVFLPTPPADVLQQPVPPLAEQRQIALRAVTFVAQTMPHLPNFYATETTTRYHGKKPKGKAGQPAGDVASWARIDVSKAVVRYRNGKEVVDTRGWPSISQYQGSVTTGIFGPILVMVISDAAHGDMSWERWERTQGAPAAVFRYKISQSESQYSIGYSGIGFIHDGATQRTAYHGEVTVDPATGAILRITVLADPPFGSPILESNIMMRYGPVEIGGKTYICPIKSISQSMDVPPAQIEFIEGPKTAAPSYFDNSRWLSVTTFTNYHLFRSEMQILTGSVPAR